MLIFPTVKDASSANSMQASEVAFENAGNSSVALAITEVNYNEVSEMVTVTWLSHPGEKYTLYYSPDLIDWATDINDNIQAKFDSEKTTLGPFRNLISGSLRGFFRLERN